MNESTAVALVQTPSLDDYLASLRKPRALQNQQALSAAYDEACNALIGPNDVQQDKGRSFKKKSAWRKLARYFNISVGADLGSVRVDRTDDGFTAYAVATASAPWGQSWTDVGACGSDEESGRRTITIADAVATAMTRASNRAVSNLIAMGEVSAEEIGQRETRPEKAAEDKVIKGVRLGDMTNDELTKLKGWAKKKEVHDLVEAASKVLTNRSLGVGVKVDMPPRLDEGGDLANEVSNDHDDEELPW